MSAGKVIVYGGTGALGANIVEVFKKNGFEVINISRNSNVNANENVLVDNSKSWSELEEQTLEKLKNILNGSTVDAIFCVAGGWSGGSASSKNFIKNTEDIVSHSVLTSLLAARIASIHLKPKGILQLTGSVAATKPTPGMIGYGLAKAAVHNLTTSLADETGGLPENSTVFALLPETLDTPCNRYCMPSADFSNWTPLSFISEKLLDWTLHNASESRPTSGSLLKISTLNGTSTISKL